MKGAFSLLKRALVPRCTRKNPKQLLCWSIARQRLHSFTFQPWFQSKSQYYLSQIFLPRVPHVRIAVSVSISGGGPERALQIWCFHCRRAHIGQGPKMSQVFDIFGHTWSILQHLTCFNHIISTIWPPRSSPSIRSRNPRWWEISMLCWEHRVSQFVGDTLAQPLLEVVTVLLK